MNRKQRRALAQAQKEAVAATALPLGQRKPSSSSSGGGSSSTAGVAAIRATPVVVKVKRSDGSYDWPKLCHNALMESGGEEAAEARSCCFRLVLTLVTIAIAAAAAAAVVLICLVY